MKSRRKQQGTKIDQKLDEEFVNILTVIENNYLIFNRHIQIRIQKWVQKLLQYDDNTVWRKIRNTYLRLLNEMVLKKKIEGVFIRMPPQGDLPAYIDINGKGMTKDPHIEPKEIILLSHQISIKKIGQAEGDTGSSIVTPICDTGRKISRQMEIKDRQNPEQQKISEAGKWQRINNFLIKNHEKLKKDKQYYDLMVSLNCIWDLNQQNMKQEDESIEFKVEEGIETNKINLFQFGSPRGMTQMQYFKAALQL